MQKKVLILGGASVHLKLVKAAKEMGYYTIVTDYLNDSPAKKIADEAWNVNITDIKVICDKCEKSNVNGVISAWLDPCQRPYQKICEKLNLPCYGTEEQFFLMTDKHAFKNLCSKNKVDIIPEYTIDEINNNLIEYPVFVKPVDSRGSRGQSVCMNNAELNKAIDKAKKESSNGDIIIEKYIGNECSFQVTYFFVDGQPFLIRTADGYKGTLEDKLDKVALCSISPSIYTESFLKSANNNVIKMLKSIGFKNGPVMLQGFYDNGKFRFFDPGLRFPGVDYELLYKEIFNVDFMKAMIEFSVTGQMKNLKINEDLFLLKGKSAAVLFPTISAGEIVEIKGYDYLKENKNVVSTSLRHSVGEIVNWTYNVNQRLAEIDLYDNGIDSLIRSINKIQDELCVLDKNKANMIYKPFDTDRIKLKLK